MMFHLEHIEPCPGNPKSLFDFYIMVDWSRATRRRGMRADTIWTAYGGIEAENPKTDSPFSRTEAIHLIRSLLDEQSRKMLRILLCFDFAYGFPRDFSAALQTATGKADAALPWLATWQYLGEAIKDDEGSVLHKKPTNRSNRFVVANTIDSLLSLSPEAPGPFGALLLKQRICIFLRIGLTSLSKQARDFRSNLCGSPISARAAVHPFDFLELPASVAKV
jgi:hypothetical protein